jgi:hypothetical protein
MASDLTITLENKPGMLADVGEAVGTAGINLSGGCASAEGGQGVIHLLVEDGADDARGAIEAAGLQIQGQREVLVVDVQDQPGTLGSYARKLADAGVNIDLFYIATGTRLVFGVDDMELARSALG